MKQKTSLQGIYVDTSLHNQALVNSLPTDDLLRFRTVEKTVLVNAGSQEDNENWIIVDNTYPDQIQERFRLLQTYPDHVIARMKGNDVKAAELELRDTVASYLTETYPEYFQRDGHYITSPLSNLIVDIGENGADPLVAVSLLATEDMPMMLPAEKNDAGESVYRLKTGNLLFANGWSLTSKFNKPKPSSKNKKPYKIWKKERQESLSAARLGKSLTEIHKGVVPHYDKYFVGKADKMFNKIEPGRVVWRRNWGPTFLNKLFAHADSLDRIDSLPESTPENWHMLGYIRSEQQTFRKLPESKAVVFGLKTYLWKLSDIFHTPDAFEALLISNKNMSPESDKYREDRLPSFRKQLDIYQGL